VADQQSLSFEGLAFDCVQLYTLGEIPIPGAVSRPWRAHFEHIEHWEM